MVIVDNIGVMMEWYLPSNSGPLRSDGVIIHTEVSWWVDGSCGESRDCTTLKGVCCEELKSATPSRK